MQYNGLSIRSNLSFSNTWACGQGEHPPTLRLVDDLQTAGLKWVQTDFWKEVVSHPTWSSDGGALQVPGFASI